MSDWFEQRRRELDEMEQRYRETLDKFWRDFEANKLEALAKWDEKEIILREKSELALQEYLASMSGARERLAEAEATARRTH